MSLKNGAEQAVQAFVVETDKYVANLTVGNAQELSEFWAGNADLIAARAHFFKIIGTNINTRSQCLLDAFNFIKRYATQPEKWTGYFQKPPFLKHCIPSMELLASREDEIVRTCLFPAHRTHRIPL
jgi:hypothetical protein